MTRLRRLASIVGWIVRRTRREADLDAELRAFVEMSAAEKVRGGLGPEEAMRQARLELGGVEPARERVRSERHGHLLDETGRDLRYALRMFSRTPGFTAVVLLTLALGIGANTGIFSLIDALMLRALPVKDPAALVLLNLRASETAAFGGDSFSVPIVQALDDQRQLFSGVAGFTGSSFDVGDGGTTSHVRGALVAGGYFETLGLEPQAGRLLTREDGRVAAMVGVISDAYWTRQFGRSPGAIGRVVSVNRRSLTIVGVSPRGFDGATVGAIADLTVPVSIVPQLWPEWASLVEGGTFWLRALARPAPGVAPASAASGLNAIWPGLSDSLLPARWLPARRQAMADSLFVFEPGATGWSFLREAYQRPLLVLMAVAGVVLLIACANIASLFLARASMRQREIAVRLAIGAARGRIFRQLLLEAGVLSCAGAALGIGVAWLSGRSLVRLIAGAQADVALDVGPNGHVLAFSAALAVATGVIFGLAPAFQARRTAPSVTLRDDARTITRRSRLLPALVAIQVALSLVLVAGAGLFARTLRNLQHVDTGFSADGVFVVPLDRGQSASAEQLADVVRAVPGVAAASVSTHTPLDGSSWGEAIVPVGQTLPDVDNARIVGVGPGFFDSLRIPLITGRDLRISDSADATRVAVINQRYADRYFPRENPIGRRLVARLASPPVELEVVGLVPDTAASDLRQAPPPMVYVSRAQFGQDQSPNLVIRASGNAASTRAAVRAALQPRAPDRAIDVRPLADQIDGTIVRERLMATLAGGFGALALLLSSVGLYGLLAYGVARRSREIGIRMALGARAGGVVASVILNGVRLAAVGLLIGYPLAFVASRAVASMLFGLPPTDVVTMAGAAALLLCAAVAASYVPARRAAGVDPLVALRHE